MTNADKPNKRGRDILSSSFLGYSALVFDMTGMTTKAACHNAGISWSRISDTEISASASQEAGVPFRRLFNSRMNQSKNRK